MHDFLTGFISKQSLVDLCFVMFLAFVGVAMIRAQVTRPRFDLVDLITGDNGLASGTKAAKMGAFVFTSWAFLHLALVDKLTDVYAALYIGTWCGAELVSKGMDKLKPTAPPPDQTVTTVQSTVTETKS